MTMVSGGRNRLDVTCCTASAIFFHSSGTVGEALAAKSNYTDISNKISATKNDWMGSLVESVVRAGVEKPLAAKE